MEIVFNPIPFGVWYVWSAFYSLRVVFHNLTKYLNHCVGASPLSRCRVLRRVILRP
jgi:hypothetical protein